MKDSRIYKKILSRYNSRHLNRESLVSQRRREIFEKLPEYASLAGSVADLTRDLATEAILSSPDRRPALMADMRGRIESARSRMQQVLTGAGYPADYLEPPYECGLCKDTGFVDGGLCTCLKQQLICEYYEQSTIKDVLEKENFTSLTYQYYNESELAFVRSLVNELRSFISHFDTESRSLLFWGNTGSGKTFFSNCVSKELLDLGYSVIYFTSFRLFDFLARHTFRQSAGEDSRDEAAFLPGDVFECDFLVIDDLGSEMQSSFVSSQLFTILNERHQRRVSTLISTNLDPQQINDLYSERVASRLLEDFNFYRFEGQDMRPLMRRRLQ